MAMTPAQTGESRLQGFIDERHLHLAEREFPGIVAFYAVQLSEEPPRTFLELVVRFEAFSPAAAG